MECSSREREIVAVATIMRHGLAFNKSNSLMDGNDDNINSLSLLEYYAPHTKPDRNLEAIETNRIADIFQPFQKNDNSSIIPKFILIEGAPGMGKTILCKEIAYQWANQCLLKDTKLLFLIHLRDLAISNIAHLKDLIHYLYAFDEAAIELSKECAKILNERNGDGLTILFDGFDEFDSSSNSLITNILGRKVLPQCRIVVTSRLTASDRLHRLADVRVEVMGFTDESKMQYIEQELKDYPDEIKKLQFYFDDHPSIKSICYMPMMMTILVYVFKEKGCLPNNPTELYKIFVALTISHYLQKQLKSEHLFTSVQTLPTGCKAFLTDLSKFAFLTLQSKQKIFTKEDIEKYCPNSVLAKSTLDSLGLINSVEYFCIDRGHSTVCSFLHLSIHEYLAALYISSIDQCMQFKELENTFLNEMCQETWNMFTAMNKRTWLTFQNYCVYCKDSYQESLSTWIANVKSSSFAECITELSDSLHDIQISSKIIQILFSQSTQSPKSNAYLKQIYLSLSSRQHIKQIEVQMFIFDKHTNDLYSKWFAIIEKLRLTDRFSVVFCTNNVLMLKNINQLDKIECFNFKPSIKWFSLVHCHISKSIMDVINYFNLHDVLRFDMVNCTFDDGEVSDELTSATQPNQTLSTSHLCGNNSQRSAVVILQVLDNISSLNVLNLQSNQLDKDAGEYISSIILNNAGLRILVLDDNNLNAGVLHIAKALQQHRSSLKVLSLGGTNIPAEICGDLALAIDCNQSLNAVRLHNNNLQSSAVIILQALSRISSLNILNLHSNNLNKEAGKCLSSIIFNNVHLEQLVLDNNDLNEGIFQIAKALQQINSMQILSLGNTNLPKEVSDELALVIECNQCLNTLLLNDNNLQCSAIIILHSLSKLSSLRVLNLQSNKLTEDVGKYISSLILNNTGLNQLLLDKNDIRKGVLPIAKALQQLNSLQVLGLGYTNMPEEASDDLALAIKGNKQLCSLQVGGNNLQSAIVVILQALCNLSSLKKLDLGSNQLGEDIGECLSHVIINNRGLNILFLDYNNIGKGVLHIAKTLQSVTSLKSLGLGYNNFPAEVCDELVLAIQSNQCLEFLCLPCNGLNSNVLQSMISISTLVELNLNSTQLLEEAGEILSSIILHNTRLVRLDLSNNSLGNGALHVMKAIQHLTLLRTLHLGNVTSGGLVSEECGEALSYAMSNNNHLKDVDLSNNNIQAVAVHVVNGLQQITSLKVLNLGNCNLPKGISSDLAHAIDCNKLLEQLLLPNNNLSSSMFTLLQALSRISTLKVLDVQGNQITEEAGEYISFVITSNCKLEQLLLNNNSLGNGISHIVRSLQRVISLRVLDLSNTNMPKEACDELALVIERNKCLSTLRLNGNNLKHSAIAVLQALGKISSLRILDLQSSQLNEDAGEYLSSVICNNVGLSRLLLNNNDVGKGVVPITKALQQLNSLQVLGLGNTNMPKEACSDLALAIECNNDLCGLQVDGNNLQSAAIIILQALSNHSSLKVLNLNTNQLTEDSGEYLSHLIFNNPLLYDLRLNYNSISKGVLHITKALQNITSLKVLGLGYNFLPSEVCDELALAIKSNQSLESLCLPCNGLNSNVLQSMISISTLTKLNLNSTQLLEEAGVILSSIILHNTRLVHLALSNNSLGNGALHVIKAIQHLTQLRILHLGNITSGGVVSEECGEALSYAMSNNNHLEDVNLSNNNIQAVAVHVVKGLQQITSLKVLNLGNCNLPKEISSELAHVINCNKYLEQLLLCNNNLSSSLFTILQALSKFSTLKVLDIRGNQITEEAGEYFTSVINKNHKLEQLLLSDNNLGKGVLYIARSLHGITSLRMLDLGNIYMPKEACNELARVINCNPLLSTINLYQNNLQSAIVVILQALSQISSLRNLDLESNQLNEDVGEYLSSVILNNVGISYLDLDNNNINKGMFQIVKALQQLHSLQELRLSCTNFPKEALNDLALVIKCNKDLHTLRASNNNLSCSGLHSNVLQSMISISTLKELNLNSTQLLEEAGEILSSIILHNTRLVHLDLSNNSLSNGALHVMKAIQHLTQLRTLHLSNVTSGGVVSEECGEALSYAMSNNNYLEDVDLSNNNIQAVAVHVVEGLQQITSLKVLNLGNCNLSKEMSTELAYVIDSNNCLEQLLLPDNNLSTSVVIILEALSRISTLKVLDLQGNQIIEESGEYFASAITNNNKLEKLLLGNNNIGKGVTHITRILQVLDSLKVLNLSNTNMSNEMCSELALAVNCNQFSDTAIIW